MHAYDVPRRPSFQSIPSARPGQDPQGGPSATPIYDALYAEYVKSYRSLPGDRSGEEELGFTAFGNIPHGMSAYSEHRSGTFSSSYSAYSAGAHSARQGSGSGQQSQWQRVGQLGQPAQQHATMHHIPAALPPGPRRGL
ncbi:hypothetical protein ACFYWX_42075 [Streptomyces sp. NPDC002888]|uniref:hypothetical protein n=1 Tax=Streptomyces sp. NPDC002888 TaxID=3364668 RepID=UPI0036A06F00